jgi:hypothetical protein
MAPDKIKTLQQVRKEYILKVLAATGWNYEKASRILKVSEEYLEKQVRNLANEETPQGRQK